YRPPGRRQNFSKKHSRKINQHPREDTIPIKPILTTSLNCAELGNRMITATNTPIINPPPNMGHNLINLNLYSSIMPGSPNKTIADIE
ncbi:MAG: hypothetical protein ACPGZU_12345, partial [Ketobacter sp.]